MKFKIKHRTPCFEWGIRIPWFVAPVLLIAAVYFDFTLDEQPWFFFGLFILFALTEILFVILYAAECITGAKVIVEDDCLDIRMFLRRKKIWFDDIDDAKFSHYNEYVDLKGHSLRGERREDSLFSSRHTPVIKRYRSRLDITLTSGKVITLNDAAPGYAKKYKLARVDFRVNADEDIELYKAYQCYRSARYPYLNRRNET